MIRVGFGEDIDCISYKVLNEREDRASAGIMFIMGLIAVVAGVFFDNYKPIPYVSGFMMLSFFIRVFLNPKFAPSNMIAQLIVSKQDTIYIGAVQKRFAWSLGLAISSVAFFMSIPLQNDPSLLGSVCMLCLICMLLMFIETAFRICVGCQINFLH